MIWCLTGLLYWIQLDHCWIFLTKLLAYTFFLEYIPPSLVFVIQKHPNFQKFLSGKFQSCSGDLCALREPLGDTGRIDMYALLLFSLEFYIVPHYAKKKKTKKIALPKMWKYFASR